VIIWVDAQLSPAIATWLTSTFGVHSIAVRDLGLREATDREIFLAARNASAVVMSKDGDFLRLFNEFGPPPRIIWLTCGNTSNAHLKKILAKALPRALGLLESGQPFVEVR
jgi:predicted nuclease of predicted toxin-antitoxin system